MPKKRRIRLYFGEYVRISDPLSEIRTGMPSKANLAEAKFAFVFLCINYASEFLMIWRVRSISFTD